MNYEEIDVPGHRMFARPGTTDRAVIKEVITGRCYRRARLGFDVEPGERWLDLGANIGAFAVYAHLRGAGTDSFEPEPGCFAVLKANRPFGCNIFRSAVSARQDEMLCFYRQKDEAKQATASILPERSKGRMKEVEEVPNYYVGNFAGREYSGLKMDIEGAEHDILDGRLLPRAHKLVLEYHSGVDRSVANLVRRLDYLRELYEHVSYEPEIDRVIASGATEYKPFFDRNIFAWGLRS